MGAALPLPHADTAAEPAVVVLRAPATAEIVPAWDDLAANALEPNPFYESWMLRPALEFLAAGDDVRLVTVWEQGRLSALLPVKRGTPFVRLRNWRHRHCLLGTPLVRADGAARHVAALVEWLRKQAALVTLDYLPADGPVYRLLAKAGLPTQSHERALFRRSRDADTYLATAASRHDRQEVRRRVRRLAERGAVAHVALRADEPVERWIDELLALEAGGWKGEQGSALACSEANRRFAREIFAAAHRRGRLQIVGLDLDGRPLARCSSILAQSGGYAFKTAYDEAFARYAPGIIVELDRIRALHEAPVEWMDSYTDAGNTVLNRLWNERVSIGGVVFANPILLKARRWLRRLSSAPARGSAA